MQSILIGSHVSVGSHLSMADLSAVNNFLFRHRISRERVLIWNDFKWVIFSESLYLQVLIGFKENNNFVIITHLEMSIIEWKNSHPLSSNLISSIQFLWVAFNNITAVFGYFVLLTAIQPFKIIDRTKYDYYERWLFSCQFKFCSSWGFENGWTVRQYGDVRSIFYLENRHFVKCLFSKSDN